MALRKILVTGAQGQAGRAIERDLRDHGYEVVGVDLVRTADGETFSWVVDLTDLGQTIEIMRGCDGVVHMAAIPNNLIKAESETFRNNTLSTWNVFQAASILGIRNVVWASSETVLGLPFVDPEPRYFPVDEDHYPYPNSHYSLSKVVGETMADQFARWHGMSIQSFRISNIMTESAYEAFPSWQDDPHKRKWNLWGYIDARDLAQACRKALEADLPGARPYIIAAEDTVMDRPTRELIAEVFPNVPVRRELGEFETLLSIERAKRDFGFAPEWTWRRALGRDTAG